MRTGSSVFMVFVADFFPDGIAIPAFSVSRLTFDMNFAFDQSIELSDVIVFFFPALRISAPSCAFHVLCATSGKAKPMTRAEARRAFNVANFFKIKTSVKDKAPFRLGNLF